MEAASGFWFLGEYLYTTETDYSTGGMTQELYRRAADGSGSKEKLSLKMSVPGLWITDMVIDSEGNYYLLFTRSASGGSLLDSFRDAYLGKYDEEGTELFFKSITEFFPNGTSGQYFVDSGVDGEDNIYLSTADTILLFDKDGDSCGSIVESGQIGNMAAGGDGRVYYSVMNLDRHELKEIDFTAGRAGQVYRDVPIGKGMVFWKDSTFLVWLLNGRS